MAKDPAFLFFPGDWLGGTQTFTRHQKGAYMDLLMAQFAQDPLSLDDVKHILGEKDFNELWELKLKKKFKQDPHGNFYNAKLRSEKEKRAQYTKTRRDSRNYHTSQHTLERVIEQMKSRMENGNGIINLSEKLKLKYIEWMDYRKSVLKKALKEETVEKQLKKILKYDEVAVIEALDKAMEMQWAGFFPDKSKAMKPTTGRKNYATV